MIAPSARNRHTRSVRLALAGLAALALGVGACGGSDDSGEGAVEDLARYLPEDAAVLAVADLDAAREELGIADDADAIDLEAVSGGDLDLESPEYQLINVAINVVPPVRQFAQTFESPPVLEALDGGAISAGAADQAGLMGAPAAIRTSQSFDELADELAGAGYERDGDLLSNPEQAITEIADAGDGIWVMTAGDEGPTAGELVESPPGGPAQQIELVDGSDLALALATSGPEGESCLIGFAGLQNADGTEGEIVLEIDGEASAEAVDLDAIEGDLDLGQPAVDGSVVTIPFTASPAPNASPVGSLFSQLRPLGAYDCG